MGLALLSVFGKRDMSAAGRGFCPESLHGMATLLPQHRAFLALVGGGAREGTIELRAILQSLQ